MDPIAAIHGRIQFRAAIPALIASALIGLAACSSSASTGAGDGTGGGGRGIAAGPAEAPTAAPTAAPMAAPTAVSDSSGQAASVVAGGVATDIAPQDAFVVRTGSLSLEVGDLESTLLKARGRIIGLGGYVSDSEQTNEGAQSTALVTYRIPAARWDEALDALHGLASKILAEQTKAVEVTGQVVDLGARIENLQVTEKALQAIMIQATRISDILDVQNQLTNVQGEIEQLTAQKNHLSDQAALGTLAVTYSLPIVAVTQVTTGWNLGTEIDHAVAQLVQLAQGLAVTGVWLAIVGLPILLGLALILALALFAARRLGLVRPAPRVEQADPTA